VDKKPYLIPAGANVADVTSTATFTLGLAVEAFGFLVVPPVFKTGEIE
jgi:hypothetical protein